MVLLIVEQTRISAKEQFRNYVLGQLLIGFTIKMSLLCGLARDLNRAQLEIHQE